METGVTGSGLDEALLHPARLTALRRLAVLDTPTEQAFDRLTAIATTFLNVPIALVSLVAEDRQFFKSCVGLPEPWASARGTPLSHCFCQHVVHLGSPLVIEDARQHPLVRENLAIRDLNVVAYAGIPLITSEGHVLGTFCAIDTEPRLWSERDIAVLSDLAAAAMTELELRATMVQLEERTERLTRLQAVTAALSGAVMPTEVADIVLDEALRATSASAGSIAFVVDGRRELEIVASRGYEAASVEAYRRFSLDAPLPMADAVRTRQPVHLATRQDWIERYPITLGVLGTSENVSATALPLIADGHTFGAIGLNFYVISELGEEDRNYIMMLARYCAQALDRARLYSATLNAEAEAQEARERVEFLLEASTALAGALDYASVLECLAELAVPALADGCIIDVLDGRGIVERALIAFADEGDQATSAVLGSLTPSLESDHPIARVLRTGVPVCGSLLDDAWQEAPNDEREILRYGLKLTSYITVPLVARERVSGALTLVSASTRHVYDEEDLALGTDLARRAAVVIDNARLFETAVVAESEQATRGT